MPRNNHRNNKGYSYDGETRIFRIYIKGRPVALPVPDFVDDDDFVNDHISPIYEPSTSLEMEWVYGYRGKDCRSNLHFVHTGELLYCIGELCILYDSEKHRQRYYKGHTDDVRSVAITNNGQIAASGQVDGHDKNHGKAHIRIWKVDTLETMKIFGDMENVDFHQAVTYLDFSKSDGGKHLCIIDEGSDRYISIWHVGTGQRLAATKAYGGPVAATEFDPSNKNVIVQCGKDHLFFWELKENALHKRAAEFGKHSKPKFITTLCFSQDDRMFTGDSNGDIIEWNKNKRSILNVIKDCQEGPIFNLFAFNDLLFSGGGRDGTIKQISMEDLEISNNEINIDQGTNEGIRTIAINKDRPQDIYFGTTQNRILKCRQDRQKQIDIITNGHSKTLFCVRNHPGSSEQVFVSCGMDNLINLWDSNTHRPIWSTGLDNEKYEGITCCCWYPNSDQYKLSQNNSPTHSKSTTQFGEENDTNNNIDRSRNNKIKHTTTSMLREKKMKQNNQKKVVKHQEIRSRSNFSSSKGNNTEKRKQKNIVAIGFNDGLWAAIDINTKGEIIHEEKCSDEKLSCIAFSPDGSVLAVGSHDNRIYLYSVNETGKSYQSIGNCIGHSSFITHIDFSKNSSYIRSNSGDHEMCVWASRSGKHITKHEIFDDLQWETCSCTINFDVLGIWGGDEDGSDINCVGVSSSSNNSTTSVNNNRGNNRSKKKKQHIDFDDSDDESEHSSKTSNSNFNNSDRLLAIGNDFGRVNLYSFPLHAPKATFRSYGGHSSHVTDVQWSTNGKILLSAGGNDTAIIQWTKKD
ncbi:hypothetical protein SNEBB_010481 [Seison nebaliae]|nr:hypothetical protein SNEBB_010481 [Seison nebaliae]